MIILKRTHQDYKIFVHGADVGMDTEPFATIRKNGEFIHHTKWTEEEQALAQQAIADAKSNNPKGQ